MATQAQTPIRVVLADKNPLVLRGIGALIEADPRFTLAATVPDGERFLAETRARRFEVGVIGWEMPGADGRAVLGEVRQLAQPPAIVVYTGTSQDWLPRLVMELGGAAFLSKSAPPEQLLTTLAEVAAGRMVFPYFDVRRVNRNPLALLTTREREMLEALASGAGNGELAKRFGVTVHTIKFHLKNLYAKLAVGNRTQAVALMLESSRGRS